MVVVRRVDDWNLFRRELLRWYHRCVGFVYVVEKREVGKRMVRFEKLIDEVEWLIDRNGLMTDLFW